MTKPVASLRRLKPVVQDPGQDKLAPHARAAFVGEENLHDYTADIAKLKATYDSLTRDAAEHQLTWRESLTDTTCPRAAGQL